jgi:hypothetical protein
MLHVIKETNHYPIKPATSVPSTLPPKYVTPLSYYILFNTIIQKHIEEVSI